MNKQTKYDWSKAPDWAQWAATDYDGRSYFYETKPFPHSVGEWDRFSGHGGLDRIWLIRDSGEVCNTWKDSLEARPQ
jgi:hypothetical protein